MGWKAQHLISSEPQGLKAQRLIVADRRPLCVQFHDILYIMFRDILYTPARMERGRE